jgi:hypothetical protein
MVTIFIIQINPRTLQHALQNFFLVSLWLLPRHSTAQHSTAQHSTAQHSTAQHSTAQHSLSFLPRKSLCALLLTVPSLKGPMWMMAMATVKM